MRVCARVSLAVCSQIVIDLVISTDMKMHFALYTAFNNIRRRTSMSNTVLAQSSRGGPHSQTCVSSSQLPVVLADALTTSTSEYDIST